MKNFLLPAFFSLLILQTACNDSDEVPVATVRGVVRDYFTSLPSSGVDVFVSSDASLHAVTDATGHYMISDVPRTDNLFLEVTNAGLEVTLNTPINANSGSLMLLILMASIM